MRTLKRFNSAIEVYSIDEAFMDLSNFSDQEVEEVEDFDFNQDFEMEEETRSPGWIRYQKRIK